MSPIKRYHPDKEKELHEIIKSNLSELEDGLKLLQHEYPTGKGIVDLLCIDAGGRLVIIEVKLHEDENALYQVLKYYSEIENARYQIANLFQKEGVKPEETPRIILVAESFSDDVRRLSTLVKPDVELYSYGTVEADNKEKGVVFQSIPLPFTIVGLSTPTSIDGVIRYMRNKELVPVLENARESILSIDKDILEYPTQSYIGYRLSNGRQLAYIQPYRNAFEVTAVIVDEEKRTLDYESKRIQEKDDTISDIMDKIRLSFLVLK